MMKQPVDERSIFFQSSPHRTKFQQTVRFEKDEWPFLVSFDGDHDCSENFVWNIFSNLFLTPVDIKKQLLSTHSIGRQLKASVCFSFVLLYFRMTAIYNPPQPLPSPTSPLPPIFMIGQQCSSFLACMSYLVFIKSGAVDRREWQRINRTKLIKKIISYKISESDPGVIGHLLFSIRHAFHLEQSKLCVCGIYFLFVLSGFIHLSVELSVCQLCVCFLSTRSIR